MPATCTHSHHEHDRHYHEHPDLVEGLSKKHVQRLWIVLSLSLFYFVLLLIGGWKSHSVALLAGAAHKLGDTSVLALAMAAAWFSGLKHSPQKTFSYARADILAALINGGLLLSVGIFVGKEALDRLLGHAVEDVEGQIMLPVALIGFVLNLISVNILHGFKEQNLNVKGAYFHIMADVLGSTGTAVSAALILFWHWMWVDGLSALMIAGFILLNAWQIVAEALHILMESTPRHLDLKAIRAFIQNLPGVRDVHDLHAWTITLGKEALLAHVVVDPEHFGNGTLERLEKALREQYALCHITLQLEPPDYKEDEMPF